MDEKTIQRLVQIGTVTAVDTNKKKARVQFPATLITSNWLSVLQRTDETITVSQAEGHTHTAKTATWMPKIGDNVVVLYMPIFNSDGFILGGIS